MSVSLIEVLEHAGYDIENNVDDAEWFLALEEEFEELVELAQETISKARDEEYNALVKEYEKLEEEESQNE